MKICTVLGARPQFIKAAALSRAIADEPNMTEIMIHTGQHFDQNMADIFFSEMGLPEPGYALGISGGTHGQNTGRMLEAVEKVLLEESPDWVVLYGDTNSTLAGALAAAKLNIRVAHIEAGLRSFNARMPEEINRIITDKCSDLLFAPTKTAVENLIREGTPKEKIILSGDIMYDCALLFKEKAKRRPTLQTLGLQPKSYILATVHRQESTDGEEKLASIFRGLGDSGQDIILPLHPRTRKALHSHKITPAANIKVIDPVGYLDMINLQSHARLIATDSGGMQKEAFFQKVPCITLRTETEWVELVDLKVNKLVGTNSENISAALKASFDDIPWSSITNPYGDGKTANLITSKLQK